MLACVSAEWQAPPQVRAVTTTRAGGVSSGEYDSLNLAQHVGDKVADVQRNRVHMQRCLDLPATPAWLQQTHSTRVLTLPRELSALNKPADGSVAFQPGVVCAVLTADCLPLFLTNRSGTKIGVVHAGWRGMADGIIEQGVAAMQEDADQILAWAGPCISGDFFEIGAEVKAALGGAEAAYRSAPQPGKFYADLYQLCGERLATLGVSDYGYSEYCTYRHESMFFSHRRDQAGGRMASLIWLED
ncbi:MAG: peptidoglycan editing factor PgeF [Gammaproteobacteria bacterium]|nr:peptidoglycan editing factor PgeF [Gammaproteobacteria bacterium]